MSMCSSIHSTAICGIYNGCGIAGTMTRCRRFNARLLWYISRHPGAYTKAARRNDSAAVWGELGGSCSSSLSSHANDGAVMGHCRCLCQK